MSHRLEDRSVAHPAGQADTERRHGKLQRKAARRMPKHKLVLEPVRRQEEDISVEDGIQLAPPAQLARLQNAGRVRAAVAGCFSFRSEEYGRGSAVSRRP